MTRRIIPLDHVRRRRTRCGRPRASPSGNNSCRCSGVRSTFQNTILRVSDAVLFERSDRHHQHGVSLHGTRAACRDRAWADVLLEPMRRDSGPAIAAGAAFAQMRDKDAVVLALAADTFAAIPMRLSPPAARAHSGRCGTHRDLRRAARTCATSTAISARAKSFPARCVVVKFVENPIP